PVLQQPHGPPGEQRPGGRGELPPGPGGARQGHGAAERSAPPRRGPRGPAPKDGPAEVAFYEQFLAQRGTGRKFQAERVKALLGLGSRTSELGGAVEAAIPHFRQAEAAAEALLRDSGGGAQETLLLAESMVAYRRALNLSATLPQGQAGPV